MKQRLLSMLCLLTAIFSAQAQTDTTPTPQWRPVYHFTPARNWTNDPNGLIFYNGTYHLYNQQNPFENVWGHMSWGHATSKDLLHFTHWPIAIPETIDKDTNWRYSGCVVNDKNNTSGFCKNGGCLVAIYTVHQPNRQLETQCIAYSNDGGMSYTNYEANPVLNLGKTDFRDPNVRWNDQLQNWIMVVALPHEHAVQFYSSPNLKDWTLLSTFGNNKEGFHDRPWECPFLVQLPVDGNPNNKKWALFVSSWGPQDGPFMQYFVGTFDGKTFSNDNPGDRYHTVDAGNSFYAAIPFTDQPQGKETMVGWMVPLRQATYPWRGQFSIPRELGLHTTVDGLRLTQEPATMITDKLRKLPAAKRLEKKKLTVTGEMPVELPKAATGNSYWMEAVFTPGTANNIGFKLTQSAGNSRATTVSYDVAARELTVTPITGGEIHPLTVKLPLVDGKLRLQILLDKSSLEVFVNEGAQVLTTYVFPRAGENGLAVFSTGGSLTVDRMKLYGMD